MVTPQPGTRAVVFDWRGPYGHFRKPYTTASPVSYPIPPPTAVAGLLGNIAGWPRDACWSQLGSDGWGVAIRLLKPIRRLRAGMNLLILKGSTDYRPRLLNPHRPTPMEFLVDPAYRVCFWHRDPGLMHELTPPLRESRPAFTPCLGLAGCLAEIDWIGEFPVLPVPRQTSLDLKCVIPTDAVTHIELLDGSRHLRSRVPARMEGDRVVTRYQEIVLDETAAAIRVTAREVFQVGEEEVLFL